MMLAVAVLAALISPFALPLDAWRADSAVEIQDAYKWIYQATQGGEHAAPSQDQAVAEAPLASASGRSRAPKR